MERATLFSRLRARAERFRTPASRKRIHALLLGLYFLEFLGLFLFLLWKCPYGFVHVDESNFLATPLRFVRGDRMLIHEWHPTQFGLATLVPAMWIYLQLAGTTDGIFLAFRYLFTFCWAGGALFLYLRGRRISDYGARCASLFLLCFAPYGLMCLSYNSLCILYLLNSALFLLCARRHLKAQFLLSGVFFAGAVLCSPFLAFIYLFYTLALGLLRLRGKKPRMPFHRADAALCWRFFTLGAALSAAVFLFFLCRGLTLRELSDGFRQMTNDPEHASSTFDFLEKLDEYCYRIAGTNRFFLPMLVTLLAMILVTFFRRNPLWYCAVCAAEILYLRQFMAEFGYINFLMFPLTFVGIYVAFATRDADTRGLALFWLIPGILYTFLAHFASNQHIYIITCAACVPSAASLLMMVRYCGEMRDRAREIAPPKGASRRALALAACAVTLVSFFFQMKYQIPIRFQSVYWDEKLMTWPPEERGRMEAGPLKGLITFRDRAEKYAAQYADIEGIDHQRVLFFASWFWLPVNNENENAACSTYLWSADQIALDRLLDYWDLRPEKIPELIYVDAWQADVLDRFDPAVFDIRQTENGNYLLTLKEGQSWPNRAAWNRT